VKLLRFLISGFWLSLAVLIIVTGLLFSIARLLLPELGKYHDDVAVWVGEVLGQPVKIGALRAAWHGLGPGVELREVTVLDATGKQAVLQFASARIDINLWDSLREWQFEPGQLTVRGLHLAAVRGADGRVSVMGLGEGTRKIGMDSPGGDALKRWLQHQGRLAIQDSSVEWRDLSMQGRSWAFKNVNLQLRNQDDSHRLDGTVDLPAVLGQRLQIAVDIRGNLFAPATWLGRTYVRGTAWHLGEWWDGQPHYGIIAVQGTADFKVWSEWGDGVQQAVGDVHAHSLQVTRQVEPPKVDDAKPSSQAQLELARVQGGFRWQRRAAGWVVDIDRFAITDEDLPVVPAQLRIEYSEDKAADRRIVRMGYSELRAQEVTTLLLAAQVLPMDIQQRLAAMALRGKLSDGYLRYQTASQQAPQFVFHTRFSGLAWQSAEPWPGATGVTGSVTTNGEQGVVTLSTETASVDFSNLFRAPLPVDALAGSVYWRHDSAGWRVFAHDLTASNEDLKIKATGYLDKPLSGASPYLDLVASFGDGKGDHVSRYLPAKIMHAKAVAWLDKAVVNGRVSGGSARIYGRLADFPFDKGQGLFEIRFDVTDGILDYAAGWPRLEEIETAILFRGRRFEAHAASAKSLNSEVLEALVTIPDMTAHPALLTVDGDARGPTSDAVRYITESPLRNKLGRYLSDVSSGGQSRLHLSLKLPLAKQPAKLNGALRLSDSSLLFNNAKIDLTHIRGKLNFTEQGLSAKDIDADLLGEAVTIAVKTTAGREGATTTFSAQGTMDAATTAKRFTGPLAAYVDGNAAWSGTLRIPPRSAGWVELEVASSLQGVAVHLPAPMGKTADEARELLVQLPLPIKDEKPIHIRYGELTDAQLAMSSENGGLQVKRGEVRLGVGIAALPSQAGVRVVGSLPFFDEGLWAPIMAKQTTGKARAATPVVNHVDMLFKTLKLAGRQLDNARLVAGRGDNAWDININSDQAVGKIHLPDSQDAPLEMDMDRLYLPRFKKGAESETDVDPRKTRPLTLNAKSFHYGNLDLGALFLSASRKAGGLGFDDIHTHSPQRDLKISGQWLMEDGQPQTSLKVSYDGDNAGDTLTSLGFTGMIKGGKTHTDAQLQWPGSPADFALAKAMGSIGFQIKDGRLLEVEPGAGRILGLLSFQALPRRLVFDFSDLFQKGFSFDTLSGSFTIEKGNAYTDNLIMDGPAARIEARGRVGLAAEDYDQRVSVIPSVSAGLPVAGALAGGVGAGAALFLVEKIIKPGIDKITKVDYQVTGPWANPTVTRITATDEDGRAKQGKK